MSRYPRQSTITIHGIVFVHIPAGMFEMGSDDWYDDERPSHTVTITNDFFMSDTLITQEQYQGIIGKNPSTFHGDDHPVECVSWDDAHIFCTKLAALVPQYTISLPTEAEWEYACRGNGSVFLPLMEYAWYHENSKSTTHPVAKLKPNAFGLYDMLGNVCEWCEDKYDPAYYASSPTHDPRCDHGTSVILRGGGWGGDARDVRAPDRHRRAPATRGGGIGFRCVLRPRIEGDTR